MNGGYGRSGRYEHGSWISGDRPSARMDACQGCGRVILHEGPETLRYCPKQYLNALELPGCEPHYTIEDYWYGAEGTQRRDSVQKALDKDRKEAQERHEQQLAGEPDEQSKQHAKELVEAQRRKA